MKSSDYHGDVVYIAGPMRGRPLFNWPAFYNAEKWFADRGYRVINPARLDTEATGFDPETLPADWDWSTIPPDVDLRETIARDLTAVMDVDFIAVLPGWETSAGVLAELALAAFLNLDAIVIDAITPTDCYADDIRLDYQRIKPVAQLLRETLRETRPAAEGWKDSNPKDAIGSKKTAFCTVPGPALASIGNCLLHGALKYGRHNYRAIGVRSSVYFDAAMRHLYAWWEGEDTDPDSGLPHLAHGAACFIVLMDAIHQGKLQDDRPPKSAKGWIQTANDNAAGLIKECQNPVAPYTEANRSEWEPQA